MVRLFVKTLKLLLKPGRGYEGGVDLTCNTPG